MSWTGHAVVDAAGKTGAGRGIPESHVPANCPGFHPRPVGTQGDRRNGARNLNIPLRRSRGDVPDVNVARAIGSLFHVAIAAAGGEQTTVGRERQAGDKASLRHHPAKRFSTSRIPHSGAAVRSTRRHPQAARVERGSKGAGRTKRRRQRFGRVGGPDARRILSGSRRPRAGDQHAAIGAERDLLHGAVVPHRGMSRVGRGKIPYQRFVLARCEDAPPRPIEGHRTGVQRCSHDDLVGLPAHRSPDLYESAQLQRRQEA